MLDHLHGERVKAYCYARPSVPGTPVIPFVPPLTADGPHSTNLSFRAVRPSAVVKPPPVLSKAAKRRQAAKEAARDTDKTTQDDNRTPTKRKRAECHQPSTPESSKGRRGSGRKTEEALPHKQASLYSFFSSPQRQTHAHAEEKATDEDEGEEEYGRIREQKRLKGEKTRKRRKKDESPTLEQVEQDARQLVFPTTGAEPRRAASKAARTEGSRADTVAGREQDENFVSAEEGDFHEASTKQCALGLHTSQADYNRNVLEELRQHYQDISQPCSSTALAPTQRRYSCRSHTRFFHCASLCCHSD